MKSTSLLPAGLLLLLVGCQSRHVTTPKTPHPEGASTVIGESGSRLARADAETQVGVIESALNGLLQSAIQVSTEGALTIRRADIESALRLERRFNALLRELPTKDRVRGRLLLRYFHNQALRSFGVYDPAVFGEALELDAPVWNGNPEAVTRLDDERLDSAARDRCLDRLIASDQLEAKASALGIRMRRRMVQGDIDGARRDYEDVMAPELSETYAGRGLANARNVGPSRIGEVLPPVPLPKGASVHGSAQQKADPRQLTLLHLWTATCGYCRMNIRELRKIHAKYAKSVRIVGVCMDADTAEAKALVKDAQWEEYFPSKEERAKIIATLDVDGYPTTFLTDSSGTVVAVGLMLHAEHLLRQVEKSLALVRNRKK